jgi:hypothetical protein
MPCEHTTFLLLLIVFAVLLADYLLYMSIFYHGRECGDCGHNVADSCG